ncbi:hypothetical protein [Micromonospora marina]|uniref:hypothetical protein n=1 Tax=Micromonospora marina TaxID=307120 RepID=UPI003453A366
MTALRMVALDLSLAGTGIAATHDHHGEPGVLARTVLSPWGPDRPHDRIQHVLVDVAAAVSCQPHLIVVEAASYGSVGNMVDQLAGLRWVIRHWLWSRKLPYVQLAPATVKVWATGSAAAQGENKVTKADVREAITATYGRLVHVGDDNQADAMSMLSAGMAAYGQPLAPVVNPRQLRALKTPSWPTLATEGGPVVPGV